MYRLLAGIAILTFVGCDDGGKGGTESVPQTDDSSTTSGCDEDGDGYCVSEGDCNEGDNAINPGAEEICDGLDNNCDSEIDEGVVGLFYADADGDGFGDAAVTSEACEAPAGYVVNNLDCNDANSAIFPDAAEICDGLDNNCDGEIDEFVTTAYHPDTDGDTYGDMNNSVEACEAPPGYVEDASDCDDSKASAFPGNLEICDEVDNDCDGITDEGTQTTYYADLDGDTFGSPGLTQDACSVPNGYTTNGDDCDDSNADVNPDATEVCNSIDDNCDGQIDENSATDVSTWYQDLDGDGFGDAAVTQLSCLPLAGYVSNSDDCDDTAVAVNPAAQEICNGIDDDCDGSADENSAIDASTWYMDLDSDGYGNNNSSVVSCTQPSGYVANNTDCNDGSNLANPGLPEVCDSLDNNCDGRVDENSATDATTWYQDLDSDTYGNAAMSQIACTAPAGYVTNSTDCNDARNTSYPGAPELCNGFDDDCDGTIDEDDALDVSTWYQDGDNDGYGAGSASYEACSAPAGYVSNNTDCDDTVASTNPGATEYCNGVDDDCNGTTDESSAADASTWYIDVDHDSYGNVNISQQSCSQPNGYVADYTDCNDGSNLAYPGGTEVCDSLDNNCDGLVDDASSTDARTWYQDLDSDNYGNATISQVACSQPSGYILNSTDCNDARAASYPGAPEYCNGYDDDCDGTIDEDAALDVSTWYQDSDGDNYGNSSVTDVACSQPSGYVSANGDCDDTRANVYPSAPESCDSLDNDCDGAVDENANNSITWYRDVDGDNYGDINYTQSSCTQPVGYVASSTDCNDLRNDVYPGAAEYCDGVDNDCDGSTDESSAVNASTWYQDSDADTYGNASVSQVACNQPTGYVLNSTDCDDTRALTNPGATEYCNGYDDDCDGTTDENSSANASTWYRDVDSDTYGNASVTTVSCSQPSGYVANSTDCNDSVATINPGATEYCNGVDDDCDGTTDEAAAANASTWYRDADSDTYGNASSSVVACNQPSGYVTNSTDCDDLQNDVYPGAPEYCDGDDNDCDGSTDENPVDGTTFYADLDGDGTGDYNNTVSECSLPSGYVENDYDCNDSNAAEPVVADAVNGSNVNSGSFADPYFSLQDAINDANECVIAMRGTYNEVVDLGGKTIDVWGVEGSDLTTIDANATLCNYANPTSCESAVTIASGTGAAPTLHGFTITGGSGEVFSSVTNTTCADSSASHSGANTCSVTIYEYFGGGLYIDGDDPVLEDIVVRNNSLPEFDQVSVGAFSQYWLYSYGGGIALVDSLAELTGVTIYTNFADQGGGIYVSDNSTVTFDQGVLDDNTASDGAGVMVSAATAYVTNAEVYCNVASTDGGGLFTETSGVSYFTNVSLYRNDSASGATHGANAYVGASTTVYLYNSIAETNSTAVSLYGVGTGYLQYNNVSNSSSGGTYGGTLSAGTGSISSASNFTSVTCDGNPNNDNFALRSTSSSINTGNPAAVYNDADGTRNDMGAHGGPGGSW